MDQHDYLCHPNWHLYDNGQKLWVDGAKTGVVSTPADLHSLETFLLREQLSSSLSEFQLAFFAGWPYTCLNLLERIPRKFILAAGFWHILVSNIATTFQFLFFSMTKTSTFSCQRIYKWQFVCLHLTGVQTKTQALAARPRSLNLCKMLVLCKLENARATAKASIFTKSKESSPPDCLVYFSTAPPLDNKLGIVGIPSLYSNRANTCLSLPACCKMDQTKLAYCQCSSPTRMGVPFTIFSMLAKRLLSRAW